MAERVFNLGTALKISTLLSSVGASSVKITIEDPGEVVMVSDADMISSSDTVYYYIYQSGVNDSAGEYIATIKAVYGSYTALDKQYFNLAE